MSPRALAFLGALLLAAPGDARADAFVGPPGKVAVEVTITVENLADHPGYTFVLAPDECWGDRDEGGYTVLAGPLDDDGRSNFTDEGCMPQRLLAFPRDTYPLEPAGTLPAAARDQLDGTPSDARVLVAPIAGEGRWWVPERVPLAAIRDMYTVAIADGKLSLTPTRVLFRFANGGELDRPYTRGKRPRLPRAGEEPPAPAEPPPPEPTAPRDADPAPIAAPEPTKPDAPAPADAAKADVPAVPAAPATPPAATPAAATPAATIAAEPWPRELVLGGICLVLAAAAALALRRRSR